MEAEGLVFLGDLNFSFDSCAPRARSKEKDPMVYITGRVNMRHVMTHLVIIYL